MAWTKFDRMAKLTSEQVAALGASLPGWSVDGEVIRRTYEFKNFVEAMAFVTKVAILSEKANHHPDIDIRWNRVSLALTTHDAGGLTEKDTDLAAAVDAD
jgi:4a-hydroxytetrahydrobiopterin dehydratase